MEEGASAALRLDAPDEQPKERRDERRGADKEGPLEPLGRDHDERDVGQVPDDDADEVLGRDVGRWRTRDGETGGSAVRARLRDRASERQRDSQRGIVLVMLKNWGMRAPRVTATAWPPQ